MPTITYVVPIIHDKFISRFLYTLWRYSQPDSFRVVLVDQCKERVSPEVWDYIKDKVHLYLHPIRNLGYAKAMNEGIIHGLHWNTPYICCTNDDIEIMNKQWIEGIWHTFSMDEKIMAVVPMSPRVAGWGYGVPYYPEILPYKEEFTEADYDYLLKGDFTDCKAELPKTFPRKIQGSVVDGAAFIMPYFKREALLDKVGLMDEHFFSGSGEDYDWNGRAYRQGLRCVATSYSWVWHHWSKSKDLFASGELEDPYYKPQDKPYWNNMGQLWRPEDNEGNNFDCWGHYHKIDDKGNDIKIPLKRIEEVYIDQI